MQNKSNIPKSKNGFFSNIEDLHTFYNHNKEKYASSQNIPIIFSHTYKQKTSRGAFLFWVKPVLKMRQVFQQMVRRAIVKHKELDKGFQENSTVRVMDTKYRLINFESSKNEESVKEASQKYKDQDGFLHCHYNFSYENQFNCYISGFQIGVIAILAIPAIPIFATYMLYDWASDRISNISLPSFQSNHSFKYKEKFSLQERRNKFDRIQNEFPGNILVIMEKHARSSLPDLPFYNFMIEQGKNYRELWMLLQKRILNSAGKEANDSKDSIFFVIGGKIPNQEALMKDVYDKFKDEDGFLYITYQEQERF